ncbi:leucine rich repeat containing 15 [Elysia marginata]|uniref:Leucine rich repeat containing 15 n=1 Tax=Elysia marginata TaxID=1093978 RepID=A0AAV4ICU8_9GAST|nr:leucine rich repeat containing 15 [Elysia marginata]
MKLQTTVLVLWVGAHFIASVTSGETCKEVGNSEGVVYDNASHETIFNGTHPLTAYNIISIMDTNIDRLRPGEWTALSHAVEIYIGLTDLKELPAAGFGNFTCLWWLTITNSLIKVIPQGAFPNTIDATDSHCSDNGTTTDSKLAYLDLGNNTIRTIEDNSLMAASLKTLYLNDNKIKDIAGKFKFLSGLQALNLRENKIESLERSSLHGLINLESLDLTSNVITHISDDAFYYTKRLHTIYLDSNRITSLAWIFRKNQLSTVAGDLFMALPGLEILNLWRNPLQCSEDWTYLQQKYPGKLYIDDIKCRPSPTVTNKFAENPVSNLQTPRHFDIFTSPLLVKNTTPSSTESRRSTDMIFPPTWNTTESRKSTNVNFLSTRNTTESRKSTNVNFPSNRNTTKSRKSTNVNFPSNRNTTESRKSTNVNFPSNRNTTESNKSTDVNFPLTRNTTKSRKSTNNTTESRKSTDVNFQSTRNTTESRKSTDVNFPSTPDDSSRSQTTATATVISVTLLVVCVVCAVTGFVLWRRKKKHGKEEIASQPTPGTAARYSSNGDVKLALGLRDA